MFDEETERGYGGAFFRVGVGDEEAFGECETATFECRDSHEILAYSGRRESEIFGHFCLEILLLRNGISYKVFWYD